MNRVTMGMPYVVGRKVAPPDQTTVVFEETGPLGRTVAVRMDGKRATTLEQPPASPTVRITLSPEHFIRLGCGREAPAEVLGAGEVSFDGDAALGAQVIEAMDFMI
jgi:putative sterol carrier protein